MTSFHDVAKIRRTLVDHAAEKTFDHGLLRIPSRDPGHFFGVISPELTFALLQTVEAVAGHPQAVAPPPVRILPLGDSITYGMNVDGGYRWPLYQLLTNAGYSVDFTGTQTGNSI